ncbi:hydroxymyristoyl-ACP dehydratase [Belnapia rosea]|uniref:Predicted 3-hydroxylacyl-ACP dehydratase, HotDog domain n=1 Tax=Belnapia rosea TaxID=938405 RepID=A0A1G6QNL7_9PROT|nr:hydroxymyristoyl-ACP dehydratase [Belnapia rosea]SDC93990.1 Predicted 3-hydroxylacyl-ACP dehydratase, HotDog domain [Belnapia rosea]
MLNREAIAALVPHQGAMCLLDRALSWDAERILCEADSHALGSNPLRRGGMLPAVCGLEFALQAMALHGALSAGGVPQRAGFVSSLRDVRMGTARLDTIAGPLRIEAVALVAEAGGFIYRFEIAGEGRSLLSGQAAVIIP